MTLSVSKTDGNTFLHTQACRKRKVSAYMCLNSFHQHCLYEFSSYGNVKPWLLLADRNVQSKSVNRVPAESSAQSRVHQEQDRQKLTTRVQTTYGNHFKMGLYDLNNSNCMCAASYIHILCTSQINEVRHLIRVQPLVFQKPFGKIRF